MALNALVSPILQLLIFAALPILWWAVTGRNESLWRWLGLRPVATRSWATLVLGTVAAWLALSIGGFGVLLFSGIPVAETAVARFLGLGTSGLVAAVLYAVVQTSLAEEIVFRGFLLKRIAARFGFWVGNSSQSVLFGLLHAVAFAGRLPLPTLVLAFAFPAIVALVAGVLNEKLAGGSILPSWALHAASNLAVAGAALYVPQLFP